MKQKQSRREPGPDFSLHSRLCDPDCCSTAAVRFLDQFLQYRMSAGTHEFSKPPRFQIGRSFSVATGGGIESDPNFSKLSSRDRQLHLWAMAQTRNQMALQANVEMMPQCAEADTIAKQHSHPLGDKPLVDMSTDMGAEVPDYAKLQTELLSLSQNSKQIIAEKSGHFIIIDRPDVVIEAIRQAVQSVRGGARL
jgi:pimeloyl-ACP methyl ester carboxylesterase